MSSPTPIDVYSLIQPELLDKNELIRILESVSFKSEYSMLVYSYTKMHPIFK